MNYILYSMIILLLAIETKKILNEVYANGVPLIKEVDRSFAVIDVEFGNYLVWCYDNGLAPGHADSLTIYLNEDDLENMLIEVMLDEVIDDIH